MSRFPPGFLFGAATAAFQIEGSTAADGKGESIWDVFCAVPGTISTGETGEPACDHYRRFEEDVALAAGLGLGAYRFSVGWARVLPEGSGRANERGLSFYDRLVDALLEKGIRPFVTLYHWDLPQALQERGGWGSRDSAGWFAEYAGLVAGRLGDRVRDWVTLNEPEVAAFAGHAYGVHPPGFRDWGLALRAAHNLLRAHRAGEAAIRTAAPGASVGIALNLSPCEPAGETAEDGAAALRRDGYLNRWFLDPVFGRGYPADMVAEYGALLEASAPDEAAALGGRLDFLGVNYYARRRVRAAESEPLRIEDLPPPEDAEVTEMGWEVHPQGLAVLLRRVHREYGPPRIYVTENGIALPDGPEGDDPRRIAYLGSHLAAVASALEAGVPVEGYFVWSLLDNFEWQHGTSKRFGLVYVDYATQRRTVKASGRWYASQIGAWRRARQPVTI